MESVFHLVAVSAWVLKKNVTSGDVKYRLETWEHRTKCSINDKIQLMFLSPVRKKRRMANEKLNRTLQGPEDFRDGTVGKL